MASGAKELRLKPAFGARELRNAACMGPWLVEPIAQANTRSWQRPAPRFAPDYRPRAHPLQHAIAALLEHHTQQDPLVSAVDGCGIPCFVLALSAMAGAYAQLASVMADDGVPATR